MSTIAPTKLIDDDDEPKDNYPSPNPPQTGLVVINDESGLVEKTSRDLLNNGDETSVGSPSSIPSHANPIIPDDDLPLAEVEVLLRAA